MPVAPTRDRDHRDLRDRPNARPDSSNSYSNPPWTFKGRALYQLSLVRVADARKYVPDSIPLVNVFGWTLGGFYLARYDDSPAGQFDELVALAGLAWNFPTSCAWAARVYVNSDEARRHGLKVVGLPSRLAKFQRQSGSRNGMNSRNGTNGRNGRNDGNDSQTVVRDWWGDMNGSRSSSSGSSSVITITNAERGRGTRVCGIDMSSTAVSKSSATTPAPLMPKIRMFLPSFSGATALCPEVLKYSLRLETKVRFLKPMRVILDDVTTDPNSAEGHTAGGIEAFVGRDVLGGRPLVCMSFEDMVMEVQKPEVVEGFVAGRPKMHR